MAKRQGTEDCDRNIDNLKVYSPDCQQPVPPYVCGEELPPRISSHSKSALLNDMIDIFTKRFSKFELKKGLLCGYGTLKLVDGGIYQGRLQDNLMQGEGRFKWLNGISYQGTFKKNRLQGRGKFTWPDDSWYHGEVDAGVPNGQGKYYQTSPFLFYIGHWKQGKRHGYGSEDHDLAGTCYYEGEWKDDYPHGEGTICFKSGNTYVGTWKCGKPHGFGEMHWKKHNQMYAGNWKYGVMEGHGEYYWFTNIDKTLKTVQPNMYKGNFTAGQRNGFGIVHYADGSKYEGQWNNNMKSGSGIFFFKNGTCYNGVFENDAICNNVFDESAGITKTLSMPPQALMPRQLMLELSFNPDLNFILEMIPWPYWTEQREKIENTLLRHINFLKEVYWTYTWFGRSDSSDNVVMTGLQFLQLIRDIADNDRTWAVSQVFRLLRGASAGRVSWVEKKILPWKFVKKLTLLAYFLYHHKHYYNIDECLNELIKNKMKLKHRNLGVMFAQEASALEAVSAYIPRLQNIFRQICLEFNEDGNVHLLSARKLLFFWKELNLFKSPLTAEMLVAIMTLVVPLIRQEEFYNIEIKLCILDFIDIIFACAEVFPLKPRSGKKIGCKLTLPLVEFIKQKRRAEHFKLLGDEFKIIPGKETANLSRTVIKSSLSSFTKFSDRKRIDDIAVSSHRSLKLTKEIEDMDKLEKISEKSGASQGGSSILQYFDDEDRKDPHETRRKADKWVSRVKFFFDHVFLPAVNHWSMITMDLMQFSVYVPGEVEIVQEPLMVTLPDARPSTIWFDES